MSARNVAYSRRVLDWAYACFAFIVVFWGAMGLVALLPYDPAEGYSMLLLIFGGPLLLLAGGVGLVLSVLCWREWPLLLNSAAFLSVILIAITEWPEKLGFQWVAELMAGGALAILVFFCVRWFGFTRRELTHRQMARPLS